MGTNYAILIGINNYSDSRFLHDLHFAEKDCTDLAEVLTAPGGGIFDKENVLLLLGADATTSAIEQAIYSRLVTERTRDDLVLIYFAGHGFYATDRQIPYIGSYDVELQALQDRPAAGVRMDRLCEDYLAKSPAGRVVLMMDCSYSGALVSLTGNANLNARHRKEGFLIREMARAGQGRAALVSCPAHSVAREDETLRNGVFTHYALRGLRGEAADFDTGDVTMESLVSWLDLRMPGNRTPGWQANMPGALVLSKPGVRRPRDDDERPIHMRPLHDEALITMPLNSAAEQYLPIIRNFIQAMAEERSSEFVDRRFLATLRRFSGARQAAIVRRGEGETYTVTCRSADMGTAHGESTQRERELRIAIDAIANTMVEKKNYHSIRVEGLSNAAEVVIGAIPFQDLGYRAFIILSGFKSGTPKLDEGFVQIAIALYCATNGLTSMAPEATEAAVLDYLKSRYYLYVPTSWYQRRQELFEARLRQITMHFQPILCLQMGRVHISGWEALARDGTSSCAPVDLFAAAESWGTRFITELDMHCSRTAAERYMEGLKHARMQRTNEMPQLSINVYPSTVMRDAYLEHLRDIVDDYQLRNKLVLEISEKLALPPEARNLDEYRKHLSEYVRQLDVAIAIDDFGVGYSSIERLARLSPSYVKIDREVLYLATGEQAIKYVLAVVTANRLSPTHVVVEGFEGDSDLSIRRLFELGVKYVQGFSFGKAGPELFRIAQQEKHAIETLLREKPRKYAEM